MIDLRNGDCLDILKDMEDNSVDLILTDPPYEIGFLEKWDKQGIAFKTEVWKECLRVLKPGAYLISFSSARTYHRIAVAIEDSEFKIRNMLGYLYGSGFVKGLNVSKAIDNELGFEREILETEIRYNEPSGIVKVGQGQKKLVERNITAATSKIAKDYEDYHTELKPAIEPIILAQKPLQEKNYARNILRYGTGGLNIGKCRVGETGRFPSNIVLDEYSSEIIDNQSGYSYSRPNNLSEYSDNKDGATPFHRGKNTKHCDEGGASRYFGRIYCENYIPYLYTSKASIKEKNSDIDGNFDKEKFNKHCTVKPLSIMNFLLNLGLPPYNSVVLDPFAGSGTTGMAIEKLNKETNSNHKCILIEKEESYCEIIKKRLCLDESTSKNS